MGWVLLIAGVALWWGGHLFKRVAPERRAAMGDGGKITILAVLVVSILLMIFGYRWTPYVHVWAPPAFMVHINNLLILIAIYLMSPAGKKGRLLARWRHPMVTGFGLWAFAHLLVNGDAASIVLFGGLLLWSVVEPWVINAAEPGWVPRSDGSYGRDAMFFAISVVLLVVIGWIHGWLGPWPFPQ